MSKKAIIILVCALVVVIGVGVLLYFLLSTGGPYLGTVTVAGTGEGLADVSVSDGRNVVKTDENGNFELPGYRKTRFITVTAPSAAILSGTISHCRRPTSRRARRTAFCRSPIRRSVRTVWANGWSM